MPDPVRKLLEDFNYEIIEHKGQQKDRECDHSCSTWARINIDFFLEGEDPLIPEIPLSLEFPKDEQDKFIIEEVFNSYSMISDEMGKQICDKIAIDHQNMMRKFNVNRSSCEKTTERAH